MNIDRTMNDNELKRMEQESAELLGLLREVHDEDNATITPRQCKPYAQKVHRTICAGLCAGYGYATRYK